MDHLKHVREQGREAKRLNEEEGPHAGTFSAHSCPYGPGDNRDAWLAGFGGQEEEVKQVDTSTPTTSDARVETPKTVREGAKPRKGSKAAKEQAAKDATTVTTETTGTGETSLKTTVAPTNPELGDQVPTPETVIGDPAASTNPAAVQTVDEESGKTVKPADLT